MIYQTWTEQENELMRLLVSAGIKPFEIVNQFSYRSSRAVYAKLLNVRKQLGIEIVRPAPKDNRPPNIIQDEAFQAAMSKAIECGLESAPIGVYVAPDNEDFRPATFIPQPTFSGCSSAAYLCAEIVS